VFSRSSTGHAHSQPLYRHHHLVRAHP
jgi:hypothetical protein